MKKKWARKVQAFSAKVVSGPTAIDNNVYLQWRGLGAETKSLGFIF